MLGSYPVSATMPAVDIKRATKFYTEVLGLKAKELGEGAVLFEAGNGTQIFMYQRGATKAEHTAASFYVDDIDKVVDGLIAKGVTFEQYDMGDLKTDARGIAAVGPSKAAWLKDTEGNILSLGVM